MQVKTLQPGPRLAPFVQAFQLVETSEEATRTLLPETGIILGFRYGGSAALLESAGALRTPDCSVAGLRGTARRIRTSAGGGMVLARFREGGAARFLDVPLHELHGRMLPLDALAPRADVDRAASRIAAAASEGERVAIFEEFLLSQQGPRAPDRVVQAAVEAIRARHGSVRIRELARGLGLGQDALEKRFRRVVGASPKQLASLVRLRHAVDAHLRGAPLSSVPYQAGYYDQSHFIREFRAATGQPPRQFFGEREYC